jgi:dihydroorotase
VGIETALPVLYTYLVKPGILSMQRLKELLVTNPRERFGIPGDDGFSIWDLNICEPCDPAKFVSMGKATPFEGVPLYGKCLLTVCDGKVVYKA